MGPRHRLKKDPRWKCGSRRNGRSRVLFEREAERREHRRDREGAIVLRQGLIIRLRCRELYRLATEVPVELALFSNGNMTQAVNVVVFALLAMASFVQAEIFGVIESCQG